MVHGSHGTGNGAPLIAPLHFYIHSLAMWVDTLEDWKVLVALVASGVAATVMALVETCEALVQGTCAGLRFFSVERFTVNTAAMKLLEGGMSCPISAQP